MSEHGGHAVPLMGGVLALGPHPVLMGILNVTPDSFSDGGNFSEPNSALAHAREMRDQGADIIDIGGESTRPGAEKITTQEELNRILPAIQHLIGEGIKLPLSIDTSKAVVADQAVQAGASIINDVHGLQREPEIADVAALYGVPLIIMHWDKERDPGADIIEELKRFFHTSIAIADKAGVGRDSLILDPGFGFSKTLSENYQILRRLDELGELGYPLLVGTSRKSMLGKLLDLPPQNLGVATAATSVLAYQAGAHIFRVHDIRENRQALQVALATKYGVAEQEG